MPEHVHLLVSEPEVALLATTLQALKISVARQAMQVWNEPEPIRFWQKRYYDHNVRSHQSCCNCRQSESALKRPTSAKRRQMWGTISTDAQMWATSATEAHGTPMLTTIVTAGTR